MLEEIYEIKALLTTVNRIVLMHSVMQWRCAYSHQDINKSLLSKPSS